MRTFQESKKFYSDTQTESEFQSNLPAYSGEVSTTKPGKYPTNDTTANRVRHLQLLFSRIFQRELIKYCIEAASNWGARLVSVAKRAAKCGVAMLDPSIIAVGLDPEIFGL